MMSEMSTAVSEIRQQAEHRLRELQPYLAEAELLQRVLATMQAPAAEARPTPPPALGDGRAPQGANKRRILALVLERPGITAAEIARITGLKRTVVASTMSRLKRTGELEDNGRGASIPADRLADTRALLAA